MYEGFVVRFKFTRRTSSFTDRAIRHLYGPDRWDSRPGPITCQPGAAGGQRDKVEVYLLIGHKAI